MFRINADTQKCHADFKNAMGMKLMHTMGLLITFVLYTDIIYKGALP